MPSRSCFFHWLIWLEWTWKVPDNSARVRVCLAASRATRALKAAECRLRVPLMMRLGMDQWPPISLTSRVVQFYGSTSHFGGPRGVGAEDVALDRVASPGPDHDGRGEPANH